MGELKHKIYNRVQSDLEEIESALHENLNPYLDLVSKTANHILFSGGKRLRPLLMVLCARICGYRHDAAKSFSTIFEYLHAATLLHDDLVDGASIRRGAPVAHSVYGNETAVLVGDFLLARALSIAAETGRPEIIQVIAGITENMSQGEIHQLLRKGATDLGETEYLEIISRKTAVLIQGACRVGALLAGAPEDVAESLSEYGLNLGLAFQMADDLLDYTADASVLGKELGADLREGKLTLPVIHTLTRAPAHEVVRMEKIIGNSNFSIREFETLIEMMNQYDGINYTRNMASEKVATAKAALSVFQPSETKELLSDIADYAVNREL
jgi:octaprenyl-diphosphate synthase